jgi:isopentenyl phosphate kinase
MGRQFAVTERLFIKIGGSFLTDKTKVDSLNEDRVRTIAQAISLARQEKEFQLVLGHGAGAYGHIQAKQLTAQQGIHPEFGWQAFYRIRKDMAMMNARFLQLCNEQDLFPITIQPSAIITALGGEIISIHTRVIRKLLDYQQIPLIHGDIVVDEKQGFTIASTEELLTALAQTIHFDRVVMISDVPGVLDGDGRVIPIINYENRTHIMAHLNGSQGIDVTGGMKSKVEQLFALIDARHFPTAVITTCNGDDSQSLAAALIGKNHSGTIITR